MLMSISSSIIENGNIISDAISKSSWRDIANSIAQLVLGVIALITICYNIQQYKTVKDTYSREKRQFFERSDITESVCIWLCTNEINWIKKWDVGDILVWKDTHWHWHAKFYTKEDNIIDILHTKRNKHETIIDVKKFFELTYL